MSKAKAIPSDNMLPEYDFTRGVRGKHAEQFRRGYSMKVHKANGDIEVRHHPSSEVAVADLKRTQRPKTKRLVEDKYRGSTIYAHVLAELVRAAQYRGLTTYQDIAIIMGLPITGSKMGKETGHCVGEISEDEVNAGRPMLSALVVKVERGKPTKPGPGFYEFAVRLGRMKPDQEQDEFWQSERESVYAAWRRPLPK
jgi:hypothetical protein